MNDDLISRQAAIDALAKFVPYAICDESTESYTNGLTDAYNLICQLPSAQPEAKAPIWKEEDRFVKGHFSWYPYCPKCDHEVVTGQCYCEICGQHIDWSEDDG